MKGKINRILLSGLSIASFSPTFGQISRANPNIILIMADDLGYGDLGCYGQNKIETPNIDALAREGMRFTQFYSGSSSSAPSRCSLFTGMHTGHAFIRANDDLPERGDVVDRWAAYYDPSLEGQRGMPAETVTFPLLLQSAGYATACVGKWGLGTASSESTPNKMGFDFFYGYLCQLQAHSYYPPFLYRNNTREYIPNRIVQPGEVPVPENADKSNRCLFEKYNEGVYSPDLMLNEIVSFVDENHNKPFLLAWTTPIPHMGLQAPQELIEYYHEKFGDEEPYYGDTGYFPSFYPKATFAAMVATLDQHVGILVEKLKELGIYENTMIVFTSDNGPAVKGRPDPDWFPSGGIFRAGKGLAKFSMHEGGIRVPMIVSWPGVIKENSESELICAMWDIFPTFCDVAGVTSMPNDGISLLPELTGDPQKQHEYLYWEYPFGAGIKAVRFGKWKGIIKGINRGKNDMMLFDLENDPQELTDLAEKYPDMVQKIRKFMDEAHIEPETPNFRFKSQTH